MHQLQNKSSKDKKSNITRNHEITFAQRGDTRDQSAQWNIKKSETIRREQAH